MIAPRTTPLLFSTPMIRALLEGRKTQTRRTIKGLDGDDIYHDDHLVVKHTKTGKLKSSVWYARFTRAGVPGYKMIRYPNRPGDTMYSRENFTTERKFPLAQDEPNRSAIEYIYQSDKRPHVAEIMKWTPSIHQPKEAARIWLECTGIRPERVQDICHTDCIAEGIYLDRTAGRWVASDLSDGTTPKEAFRYLWYEVNDVQSWLANPWVWVRTFRILSTTGKPKTINE